MVLRNTKVAVIGSGPAGYTAGIYLGRAGLSPLVIAGMTVGGQLTETTDIENYPGFSDAISGFELMDKMQNHSVKMGAEMVDDVIDKVDFSKYPFYLHGESGDEYYAESVIIATGAKAKWLGIDSEGKYRGRGVSACATCDGFFYKGKKVAVIGGGSKALEEALYLANICDEVHLIHRRDEFRAERILQKKVRENNKIIIHYDSVVNEFTGDEAGVKLAGIDIKNVKDESISNIAVSGAFVAIGNAPNTEIFKGHVDLNEAGFIVTKKGRTATTVEGIFAAGDVQDPIYCQAIIAAGTGCMAALDVQEYLLKKSR